MTKLFLPLLLALSLLGGCASTAEGVLGLPSGVLTKSVANPVTKNDLYRFENGLRVVVKGLKVYKNLCEQGSLEAKCIQVVATMQGYTRQARPLLRQLRTFVRKNDQVNAAVVYNTLLGVISDARALAAANNVPIPTL